MTTRQPRPPRGRRAGHRTAGACALLTALSCVAGALAAPAGAVAGERPAGPHADAVASAPAANHASTGSAGAANQKRRRVSPVPGVTVWSQSFTIDQNQPERASLVRVRLGGTGLRLDAASPHEVVGASRRSVPAVAGATHAIAGINADWFDLESSIAVPRGALIRSGVLLKTPRPGWLANLYVKANGRAAIGQLPFSGEVTRPAHGRRRPTTSARIYSVNTPVDASLGRITLITHALASIDLHRTCTVAYGRFTPGGRSVTRVDTKVRNIARVAPHMWALVACGGRGAQWLHAQLRPRDRVNVSLSFPDGKPAVAVSGGRVLVEHGQAFNDAGGQVLHGLNPETFACVNRTGKSLLWGVVDGRSMASAGVTQPELTTYLLHLGCWNAMTFDGGGSSTIVAKLPGHRHISVLNNPSDGQPRAVADGLFVYKG